MLLRFSPKTGQLRKLPNSDQFFKNYDRMLALLALLTHLCPTTLEESVAKTIREKYGSPKVADLFGACSPKFISPQHPNFDVAGPSENPIKHQAKVLESTVEGLEAQKELRSYLKLYTCIPVSKLVSFGNDPLLLLRLKLSSRQLEMEDVNKPSTATHKSALDIHYFLEDGEIVHIDEAEKQRRFENYFLAQTVQSYEIRKEANSVDVLV
jgi:translation initiation factor 3 subunit L